MEPLPASLGLRSSQMFSIEHKPNKFASKKWNVLKASFPYCLLTENSMVSRLPQ